MTVAQEGSFTKAAQELHLSEPAVSLQIKQLERVLRRRLLMRAPHRPVELTDAGRRALAAGERVFNDLAALSDRLSGIETDEQGTIGFAAGEGFCSLLLPSIFAIFRALHPGVTLRVDMGNRRDLLEGLRRKRFDLAIVGNAPEDPHLERTYLADIDLVLIAPPGHPLAKKKVSFEALQGERLVLGHDQSAIRRAFDSWSTMSGVDLEVSWEIGGIESQINSVMSGLGIAPVPYYMAASRIDAGQLVLLRVAGFPLKLPWHLVWRREQLSPLVMTFRDDLIRQRSLIETSTQLPRAITRRRHVSEQATGR